MSTLSKKQWQELRQNFRRSECDPDEYPIECCSCDKPLRPFKQWWLKTSVEYDEWDCYCSFCALYSIHLYDDFDFEEYERISQETADASIDKSQGERTE